MSDISKLMSRVTMETAPQVAQEILKEVREDKALLQKILTSEDPYRAMIFETSVIEYAELIDGNQFYIAVINELKKAGEK